MQPPLVLHGAVLPTTHIGQQLATLMIIANVNDASLTNRWQQYLEEDIPQ